MPAETDAESLLLMGRIWRPHGVKGEVKVYPETDDPERFVDLGTVYIGTTPNTAGKMDVESVRFQSTKKGTIVVLKLAGIDSREDADALRKASVYASEDDLPSLKDDEFFLHDLVGLAVASDDGVDVGTVDDVLDLPAQEILVVRRSDGSSVMVPVVAEFIVEIDLVSERIVIRPIEGLLE